MGLIRDQQHSAGVLVEPSHARDDGISPPPPFRQKRIDVGAFAFVVGTDKSERLVEKEQQSVRMVERFAIDPHIGGSGLLRDVIGDFAAHGDAAAFGPVPCVAPAAIAEAGEELIEAAHDDGEIAQRAARGAKEKIDFVWLDRSF